MRLIDADALHKYVEDKFKDNVPYEWAWVLTAVDSAPTIDAVPVVRCRDCVYRYSSEYCECRPENGFCSDGERKWGTENAID